MARTASLPARKHLTKLLASSDWKVPRIAAEVGASPDVIRSLVVETGWSQTVDTNVLHAIMAIPIPEPPARPDGGWRDRSACRGEDTERWFPISAARFDTGAMAICEGCPVRRDCARHAQDTASVGLWAGFLLPEQKGELDRFLTDPVAAAVAAEPEPGTFGTCAGCGCQTFSKHDRTQRVTPSRRGYAGRGLCTACYMRQHRWDQSEPEVDPGAAAQHIADLRGAGWLLAQIAETTGLTVRTLQNIQGRKVAAIRAHTARAILAVEVREMAAAR